MRSLLWGASLLVLTFGGPALADCAGDIAAVERELAAGSTPAPAADAAGSKDGDAGAAAAGSPEEVVDQMIEEGVSVEEDGADTKFAAGGLAEPRESWTGASSPEEHPAVVHLASAKQHLDQGDRQGCIDELGKARAALSEDPAAD
jgi:hypothetical protein